jgi:Uncharacterized protein conserved in bacteria
MKRILFTLAATVAGLVALLDFKSQGHPLAVAGGLPSAAAPGSTSAPSTSTPAPGTRSPGTRPSTPPARQSAGGTGPVKYTGAPIETQYGVVQVAVTVSGRHIDAVSFVRLDAFDQHSQDINSQAAPILLQETINAQSARIDTVSGATYTSDGYVQSLQSALDRAGIR